MRSLSPELASSALDAAPDAIIIIDASGAIRFANRQVSAIFGYAHDNLIGQPVELLMPERFRSQHPTLREAYTRNVRVRPMGPGLNLSGRRQDGTEFPVEISLSPIDDSGQRLIAAAIRDVTDRKRIDAELAAQLQDMHRLHEMSTRLIGAADLPKMLGEVLDATVAFQGADFGNIQLCDPSGDLTIVAQHGFSTAFLEHFAHVDFNEPSACGRALRAGERVIIEDVEEDAAYQPHRAIAAREGYRAVQSTPIRGRDGTTKGMLSTHFRQPHRPSDRALQLTDIYMRLAAELIARVQDEEMVRAARDLANRANQAKSRFLATASHDLRQPLQAISLLNGTVRRLVKDEHLAEALEQEAQSIGAMSRLLNALLDISKLESGAIKPEITDFKVAALFDELRREFTSLAADKGLQLEIEPCSEHVCSDASLVGQVIRNLVSNAIKYTRAGYVKVQGLREAACVRLEVLDTGIGIPATELTHIFDDFYQVGVSSNTSRDGYGLGLSIVSRILNLLGAKLDVRSEVGKGTAFSIALPASAGNISVIPQPTGSGTRPMKTRTTGRAHVLLVEDDPRVRNATRMWLKVEGYEVSVAATVREAAEQALNDPDIKLLVTDYHLAAGETGIEVVSAVRSRLGADLPAVLVTGDTSSAMRELNIDSRLRIASKPINPDELLGLLRQLLPD